MKAGKKKKKKGNRGDMWKSPGGVWNIFNMKAGEKNKAIEEICVNPLGR